MKPSAMSLCGVAAMLVSAPAWADSLTDYLGPREVAVGEAKRAESVGSLATTLNPSGLAMNRELVFEGTYRRQYDGDINTLAVSACDSTVPVPGCFYYRYLRMSSDDSPQGNHRIHEAGSTIARSFTEAVFVGIGVKYFDYEDEADGAQSGFAVDVGATVELAELMSLGLVGYNLVGGDENLYPRSVGAGIAIRPAPMLLLSADGVWNLDVPEDESTGRYGGGVEWFIRSSNRQTGYPIRVGGLRDVALDATFLTGGLGFAANKVAIDISASKRLGEDEVLVLAGLRVFGPRFTSSSTF